MKLFCSCVGIYKLAYAHQYEVLEEFSDSHGNTFVKLQNIRGKYPRYCFSSEPPPQLRWWRFDDSVDDPLCCCVDVRLQLDFEERWITFLTPAYLVRQLPQCGEPCWRACHQVFLPEITARAVQACLLYLLHNGELVSASRLVASGQGGGATTLKSVRCK